MNLMIPTHVIVGVNVLTVIVVVSGIVIPYAGSAASGFTRGPYAHPPVVSTTSTAVSTVSTVSTSSGSSSTTTALTTRSSTTSSRSEGGGTSPSATSTTTTVSTTETSSTSNTITTTTTTSTTVQSTTRSVVVSTTTTSTTSSGSTASSATSTASTTTSAQTSTTSTGCDVTLDLPNVPYQTGEPIKATAEAACQQEVKWSYSGPTSNSSNTHVPPNVVTILFNGIAGSSSFPPGSYTATASYDNGNNVRVSDSTTFTVSASSQSASSPAYFPIWSLFLGAAVVAFDAVALAESARERRGRRLLGAGR